MREVFERFHLVEDVSYPLQIGHFARIDRVDLCQLELTRRAVRWSSEQLRARGINVAISDDVEAVSFALAFQEDDNESDDWVPQGVSASWDASDNGKIDGRRWLAVTWHGREPKAPEPHGSLARAPIWRICVTGVCC